MIDASCERLVPICDVPKMVPHRPHISTVVRWWTRGVKNQKLETLLLGGRRYTSAEALQRFFERSTAASDGQPIPARSQRERDVAVKAALRELDRLGV
ncbi:MAG: DUF1580 domain-containing protein [Planctomycetaceae bacterium]|nr:DUF1580 domain-containing protein [Planctomycetaceae bacterium]